jgi:hypothetical protein
MIEDGRFTIYQWNGKDLFLSTVDGRFLVLSRQELPQDVVEKIQVGRQVSVSDRGKIAMVPSPEEILEEVLDVRRRLHTLQQDVDTMRRERPTGYSLRLEPIAPAPEPVAPEPVAPEPSPSLQVNVDVITYRRRRAQLLAGIAELEKSNEFPDALAQMREEFRAYEKEL